MSNHLRQAFKTVVVLIFLFLSSPQRTTMATSGDFWVTNVTRTPQPDGVSATFSSHAEWYQGVEQILYYVNDDPNGGYNGQWWQFATTNCPSPFSLSCDTSATLGFYALPISLHGKHMITVNTLLSTNADSGDYKINGRWYLTGYPYNINVQRTNVFWWAGTASLSLSTASPQPVGTNATFTANAQWDQGVEQIIFYVNADPNGNPSDNWWPFATADCGNITSTCTRSATLEYNRPPFTLYGKHLVTINVLLTGGVSGATGGDYLINGRWYLTGYPYSNPQRTKVFEWITYAHSWYINNPNATINGAMETLGKNDGDRDNANCTNSMVVLDFGQIGYEAGGSYGGYGTYDFDYAAGNPFISNSTIEEATKAYARRWFGATNNCPRLKLIIGTSNYRQCPYGGACNPTDAGKQWGNLVNNVQIWLNNVNYSWQITAWAGSDMEQPDQFPNPTQPWDCATSTRAFVDGFNRNNPANARLINYGTAWVPKPADGTCWSAADVQYVSWGASANWPLPETYFAAATDSWITVRRQYYMIFMGVMTTCRQADPITGNTCTTPAGWFTPYAGWNDLWNKLIANQVGQSSLDYATNIKFQGQ